MPAQMIDKGIPAAGLLAQVVVAKHDDHLPLYRQSEIYARSGVHIPRSSMAQWIGICGLRLAPLVDALKDFILGHSVIHADETPVSLLAPGKGKTKKAYMWVYRTTNFAAQRAVLFDFCNSRSGDHPRRVLKDFCATLVTDDYSGYHALHARGVSAAFCMAHARRKLFEAHQDNGSQIAGKAVTLIAKLYEIEREARELEPEARRLLRQQRSRPIADALHAWLTTQRQALAKADVTAKAIDYSLSNWRALTHYLDDGNVPIDNNAAENAVRPLCVGRKNWFFVGSQQAGERAAAVLSLIESAKLNGHDPWAYLKDVFERLPTLKHRDLAQLLPHNWRAAIDTAAPKTAAFNTTLATVADTHSIDSYSTRRHRRRKGVVRGTHTPQEHVFLNRCGQPMTRFGVHALVERTAAKAQSTMPTLAGKRVSPHSIRHSTATHLLSSGVEINTVRAWLGHASLETTNVYAEINLEGKALALAMCEVTTDQRPNKRWRADANVMQFLRSL